MSSYQEYVLRFKIVFTTIRFKTCIKGILVWNKFTIPLALLSSYTTYFSRNIVTKYTILQTYKYIIKEVPKKNLKRLNENGYILKIVLLGALWDSYECAIAKFFYE